MRENYSILSFVNGLIVASGIVLSILMYYAFMPIVRYAKDFSPISEVQIANVMVLGVIASAVAISYELYRWIRPQRSPPKETQ